MAGEDQDHAELLVGDLSVRERTARWRCGGRWLRRRGADQEGRLDATVIDILNDWSSAKGTLKKAAAAAAKSRLKSQSLAKTKLLPPVMYPSAIYCAGADYKDHMEEMAKLQGMPPSPDPHDIGLKPWHFIKASRTVTGHKAPVKLPSASKAVDWEAELGAVIGKKAKNVPLEKALDYVAGYTIANELSARDLGKRDQIPDAIPFKWDWVGQKCFDDACRSAHGSCRQATSRTRRSSASSSGSTTSSSRTRARAR